MPFSKTKEHHTEEYWKRHFDSYLKPLIEGINNLEAFRSEPLRGDIASQIITDLVHSEVVVADLTDHNPNVLWELGVRQSYNQCTITIAEKGTQIPFHFSHKGILFYNGEHLDNQEFEKQFLDALRNCIEKPDEPDSPVWMALGGRGTLYSIIHADENKRKVAALKSEFASNMDLIESVYSFCEKNKALRAQKKDAECEMESRYLRCSAVENLSINRYLDLNPDFYKDVSVYSNFVLTMNRFLEDWAKSAVYNETQIVRNKENLRTLTARISNYLKEIP